MTRSDSQGDTLSQPVNLASLVNVTPDGIVSRILAKSKSGNVTLFAFAGGQELSEHTSPFDALVYAVEGSAEIGVATDRHLIKVGDLLRLPANEPHWVKATEEFKMLLIMLR